MEPSLQEGMVLGVMTKSELIARRLAARFPQLVAKDADLAVKGHPRCDERCARPRRAHRNPRLRQLRAQLSSAACRTQSQVWREGPVPEKYVPHFKAGKELRERVDNGLS